MKKRASAVFPWPTVIFLALESATSELKCKYSVIHQLMYSNPCFVVTQVFHSLEVSFPPAKIIPNAPLCTSLYIHNQEQGGTIRPPCCHLIIVLSNSILCSSRDLHFFPPRHERADNAPGCLNMLRFRRTTRKREHQIIQLKNVE